MNKRPTPANWDFKNLIPDFDALADDGQIIEINDYPGHYRCAFFVDGTLWELEYRRDANFLYFHRRDDADKGRSAKVLRKRLQDYIDNNPEIKWFVYVNAYYAFVDTTYKE